MMYEWFADQVYELENFDSTFNYHNYGYDSELFTTDPYLAGNYTVTALSYLDDGTPFVASYEGKTKPIFGTQFHPEKPVTGFYSRSKGYHEWNQIRFNKVFIENRAFVLLSCHSFNCN